QQLLIVGFAMDRIDRSGIDDQERRLVIVVEESRVGFAEPLEIVLLDELLVSDAALRDALEQHGRRRLQIHDEVRLRRIKGELLRYLSVQRELARIEIELGEQRILLHEEICDADGREHYARASLFCLTR